MVLPRPPIVTECSPAVTNLHIIQTDPLPSPAHPHTHPEIDFWKGQRQRDFHHIINHPIRLFMASAGECSPDILNPDQNGCSLAAVCFCPLSLNSKIIPLAPWTSRQIAAAHFFLSPAGIVQNCDIVALARLAELETHTGHRMYSCSARVIKKELLLPTHCDPT